jgi:hypothetical protein
VIGQPVIGQPAIGQPTIGQPTIRQPAIGRRASTGGRRPIDRDRFAELGGLGSVTNTVRSTGGGAGARKVPGFMRCSPR